MIAKTNCVSGFEDLDFERWMIAAERVHQDSWDSVDAKGEIFVFLGIEADKKRTTTPIIKLP